MLTSYLEPVTTGAAGEVVIGDDGLTVTVGGPVPCDEPVTDFDRLTVVTGDDGEVVTVCGLSPFHFSRLLENCFMTTDLDCNWHSLIKIGHFTPVPYPLIDAADPRLSDRRPMQALSVTNSSVAADAAIAQSKLNLNGDIPPQYLLGMPTDPVTVTNDPSTLVTGDDSLTVTVGGLPPIHDAVTTGAPGNPLELVTGDDGATVIVTGSTSGPTRLYAAPGNAAEYKAQKGIPNGYVPLDTNRRMPLSMYPTGAPSGTLNSFSISGSPSYMTTTPSTVTSGSATMVSAFINLTGVQWFGNALHKSAVPTFSLNPFPPFLIPNFDSAKIVSGVFTSAQVPVAVGIGHPDHASGAVPDPGAMGAADDYLARDMTYKVMRPLPSYEPVVPSPSITIINYIGNRANITFTDSLAGVAFFYRVNFSGSFRDGSPPIPAPLAGDTVECYAAKIGYQNSSIVSLVIPTPPGDFAI